MGIVPHRCNAMTACRVFGAAEEISNIRLPSGREGEMCVVQVLLDVATTYGYERPTKRLITIASGPTCQHYVPT